MKEQKDTHIKLTGGKQLMWELIMAVFVSKTCGCVCVYACGKIWKSVFSTRLNKRQIVLLSTFLQFYIHHFTVDHIHVCG